jgi:hypothetical protein
MVGPIRNEATALEESEQRTEQARIDVNAWDINRVKQNSTIFSSGKTILRQGRQDGDRFVQASEPPERLLSQHLKFFSDVILRNHIIKLNPTRSSFKKHLSEESV